MTINLQELYDKGELKPGDEFICRNGSRSLFVGLSNFKKRKDIFIFENEYGRVYPIFTNGEDIPDKLNDYDIIRRAPVKRTFWLNVDAVPGEVADVCVMNPLFDTKENADKYRVKSRIACVPVEIEV